jgi:CRP-like cAMP-binding protein
VAPQSANRSANRLLAALSDSDFALLQPALKEVVLETKQLVERPQQTIEQVHFVTLGQISVIATSPHNDQRVEVAMIGPEGMTGLPVVLGTDLATNEAMVQSAGTSLALSSSQLRAAMRTSPTLHATLLRFAHAVLAQASQTALANGRGQLDQRLARWLLMWQDRLQVPTLTVTHEFLSLLLGVRRQGVTETLHKLEAAGLIKTGRNQLTVLARDGLRSLAGGFYGAPEAEYDRLLSGNVPTRRPEPKSK